MTLCYELTHSLPHSLQEAIRGGQWSVLFPGKGRKWEQGETPPASGTKLQDKLLPPVALTGPSPGFRLAPRPSPDENGHVQPTVACSLPANLSAFESSRAASKCHHFMVRCCNWCEDMFQCGPVKTFFPPSPLSWFWAKCCIEGIVCVGGINSTLQSHILDHGELIRRLL